MSKGKLVAQGGHAVHLSLDPTESRDEWIDWRREWKRGSYPKIALKVQDEKDLTEIFNEIYLHNEIPVTVVIDEGRTEIKIGTLTCIGIGPAPSSIIDAYTGGLKLL